MLVNLGYQALVASDGKEALEVLVTAPQVDLLLADVVLPGGMSGPAMVDVALADRAALKVLYMSGYAEAAMAYEGRLDQDLDLLTKPFTMKELKNRLRDVLDT